jgi:hypothetical protein
MRNSVRAFGIGLFLLLRMGLVAITAHAEDGQEVIPLDPHVGFEVDARERAQYHLFGEIPGFVEAWVLNDGGNYILHVDYERDGRRYREERPLSAEEVERLRALIASGALTARGNAADGRLRLVFHGTVYGLLIYGAQIPMLFDVESTRIKVGLYMLGTGVGFGAAMAGTQRYEKGSGYAKILTNGSYAGLYYGLLPSIWLKTNDDRRNELRDPDTFIENDEKLLKKIDRRRAAGLMVGVPVGSALAGLAVKGRRVNDAEADLSFWGMAIGGGYGVALPYLAGADKKSDLTERRIYLSSAAAMIPVGGWLGYELAHRNGLSQGRAWTLVLGGVLGTGYGVTVARILDGRNVGDSPKPYVWSMVLGLPAGFGAAYALTSEEEYSLARSRILWIGATAGALLGTGLVYVTTNSEDGRLYAVAASVGSAVAYALTHRATHSLSKNEARSSRTPALQQNSAQWQLANPKHVALASLIRSTGSDVPAIPLLAVRF